MSTELVRPIFTQEALEDYLRRMAPYVCHGRCVQVEAEEERRQTEWQKMSLEERQAIIKELQMAFQSQIDRLTEFIEKGK